MLRSVCRKCGKCGAASDTPGLKGLLARHCRMRERRRDLGFRCALDLNSRGNSPHLMGFGTGYGVGNALCLVSKRALSRGRGPARRSRRCSGDAPGFSAGCGVGWRAGENQKPPEYPCGHLGVSVLLSNLTQRAVRPLNRLRLATERCQLR